MLRHIYYTIQTLIRGRSSNVIKIISLTLGLFVGLLLFARVAFELSYDHFYPESRNLFLIQASYSYEGKQEKPSPYIYGAMPAAIRENFPDEVEEATVLRNVGQQIFFKGNERFDQQQTIYADDHFLPTMGVEVLKGNKADLVAPDAIFINESLARRVFGDADPIGQTMLWEKNYPVTVRLLLCISGWERIVPVGDMISVTWGWFVSIMIRKLLRGLPDGYRKCRKSIFRRGRMVFLRSILFNLYLSTTVVSRM